MEVLINNHPIEFQLEKEKTAKELVQSISEWAGDRGLIFLEVFLNDRLYTVDSIGDDDLKDIEIINCFIDTKSNLVFTTVEEGALYCNRVIEYIEESKGEKSLDRDEVENLVPGIEWLVEVLNKVITLLELSPEDVKSRDKNVSRFSDDLLKIASDIAKLEDEQEILVHLEQDIILFRELKEIFRLILMSKEMKDLVLKSIDSPDLLMESLQEIKNQLKDIVAKIEETAISFQTGKDEEGLSMLNEFIDFMLRYTRTCYQVAPVFGINLTEIVVNEISLEDKNNKFMTLLNKIVDAMENNDIISLSDILEYEIMPELAGIENYIELLMNEVG